MEAAIIEKEEVYEKIKEMAEYLPVCKKCDIEYEAGDQFCGECGSRLELIVAEEVIEPEPIQEEVDAVEIKEREGVEESKAEAKRGFELDVGRKWLNKIGIISIVLGMVFFIKYSVEQGYIGPTGKIIVSIIAGLALLIAGEIFNRREGYLYLARSLTGGSFAILYITIYAAHHFYNLMDKLPNLIVLGVLVILGVVFSLKYNSREIASEAFLLGYIISLMSKITSFTLLYALVLTAGLIIITERRGWGFIGFGGLAAAYLINFGFRVHLGNFATSGLYLIAVFLLLAYLVRGIDVPDTQGTLAILGLVVTYGSALRFPSGATHIFMVIFFLVVFLLLFNLLSFYMKEPTHERNVVMLMLNAFFFSIIAYDKARNVHGLYAGLLTIAIAGGYLVLTQTAAKKGLHGLSVVFLTLCITFVTITIPVQVNNELITIFWAIEGLILLLMGLRFDMKNLRYLGNGVAVVTFLKTILVDSSLQMFDANNILASTRFFAYMAPIIAFFATAVIYRRNQEKLGVSEVDIRGYYLLGGSLLLTLILILELEGWHLTAALALEALGLLYLGFRYAETNLRFFSTGVGGLVLLKAVFVDNSLRAFDVDGLLDPNYRLLAFAVPILTFYISSYIYRRNKENILVSETDIGEFYYIGAAFLLFLIFLFELEGWHVTGLWAIEAYILLILGLRYSMKNLRLFATGVAAITMGKVVFHDVALRSFEFDNILLYNSRFLAFLVPIATFYATYLVYRRNRAKLEDWEKGLDSYFVLAIAFLVAYLLALELRGGYISAAWAIEAMVLLIIGFHYKQAQLRKMGMALLAITTVKVFIMDMASLETAYRILSFIVLGIILLIASYAYSRYRYILEEEPG